MSEVSEIEDEINRMIISPAVDTTPTTSDMLTDLQNAMKMLTQAPEQYEVGEPLVKVTLVPVEVFPGECGNCETEVTYGLMDAVSAWSDCNRAIGHIYRRDDEDAVPHRDPADVITIYVPRSELPKFEKQFGEL